MTSLVTVSNESSDYFSNRLSDLSGLVLAKHLNALKISTVGFAEAENSKDPWMRLDWPLGFSLCRHRLDFVAGGYRFNGPAVCGPEAMLWLDACHPRQARDPETDLSGLPDRSSRGGLASKSVAIAAEGTRGKTPDPVFLTGREASGDTYCGSWSGTDPEAEQEDLPSAT